jgi:hypothetical protein
MQRKTAVALFVISLLIGGVAGVYAFFAYHDAGSIYCPLIFASVSYTNASGFIAVAHPIGMTEYVLSPDSVGHLQITYSSQYNNLTSSMFSGRVPVWVINTNNNTIQAMSSDVRVTIVSMRNPDPHTVIVNYNIASGSNHSLYLIGFPSTCPGALLNVGTSPYLGPLPWSANSTIF